jgi:signal transduction histidine kinase
VLFRLQLELMEGEAPPALRQRLAEARLTTERTVVELRRTIAALSPAVVERLGLEAALRQLTARFRKQHEAEVGLRIATDVAGLPRETQEVIYRVAQEALQNVFKHSQATKVKLLLDSADKNIKLSIRDNGAGFKTESGVGKPASFGLTGMRERAVLLGGALVVRSAPGKGTTVVLELPQAAA